MHLKTIHDLGNIKGKTVLCRLDLNVPVVHNTIEDKTRITRIIPTIELLIQKQARIVILSHFGRPKGAFTRSLSLAPIVDHIGEALGGKEVGFAVDCIGTAIQHKIQTLENGDVLLLENLRFHEGETRNDPSFVQGLACLGDIYVNDAFSCSHRSHASIVGLAELLPAAAGLALEKEVRTLAHILSHPSRPMAAIIGGAKIGTKLQLLQFLLDKVDILIIGGAMANTFLKAQGHDIGTSLYEESLIATARDILQKAQHSRCEIILPQDVVAAKQLRAKIATRIVNVDSLPSDHMMRDYGPNTLIALQEKLRICKTIIWNGPVGAFEYQPFDVGTISLARHIAYLTRHHHVLSIAGGGDIVSALACGGLKDEFSYLSTAGGAFLEWLEGKELPGIKLLYQTAS